MSAVLYDTAGPAAVARSVWLRDLHPGWFGAVMGTGILAVAAYRNPGNLAALHPVTQALGIGLGVLTAGLAVVLLGLYVARWVRHRKAAAADLRHPVRGPLYATLPGGVLVLAVVVWTIGPRVLAASVVTAAGVALAILGAGLAFVVAVAFGLVLFTGDVPVAQVNGGWLIPPVVTVIVPIAVVPALAHVSPASGHLLLALGYAYLGMGLLLFLLIMGLLVYRLIAHPLPPAALAPSLWIGLGPVGAGSLALTGLASVGTGAQADTVREIAQVAATGLWGFGLWWLTIVTVLTVRYVRAGPLPFSPGWWAFTFPLGVYAVATLGLARQWHSVPIEAFGALLSMALASVWTLVAARSACALRRGETCR